MNKLVTSCFLLLSCSVGLHSGEYICSQPVLNMHVEPKSLSEVVSQVIWADSVQVVDQSGTGWAKVVMPDSTEGWVPFDALTEFEDSTYPKPNKMAKITSAFAHIYLVRDVRAYPPLLSLPYGALVEVVNSLDVQADRFAQVRLVNGEVAYMLRSDIVINPGLLAVDEMLDLARHFVGTPYTWGGNSAYGFDAAGFTQMLYKQMGYLLPRDSEAQSEMAGMWQVSVIELSPGDFLFFSQRDDGLIDHVGCT